MQREAGKRSRRQKRVSVEPSVAGAHATMHLLGSGSGPPCDVSRSVSPSISSNTLAVVCDVVDWLSALARLSLPPYTAPKTSMRKHSPTLTS